MIQLKNLLRRRVEQYLDDPQTIVVLKGIDINLIKEIDYVDIQEIFVNKLKYFMEKIYNVRKILIYDEYIALGEVIRMQYKNIIVLSNNIYINYYPLYARISEEKLNGLISHFDEEKEGDTFEIGDISEFTLIYSNVKNINNRYYVSYNDFLKYENEKYYTLFEFNEEIEIVKEKVDDSCKVHVLNTEEDYLSILQILESNTDELLYIVEKNTTLSRLITKEKAVILNNIYKDKVEIRVALVSDADRGKPVRKEYKDILKKYWGYDNFRNIEVYDLHALDNNEKKVKSISQSEIIENIVTEAEKCLEGKDYKDIFVTAPTGAGKSLMFQIPAIYLAETNKNLFTIVISPLIGLMKDQVNNLELHNYKYARTINSDITPIQKEEILNYIVDGKCNILYLSPESLLSKSDIEQIIGSRTLGFVVIDEAHIVTTWGKQFRPDYWYLGDHLNKIKKAQLSSDKKMGFVVATFTATAIYGGIENMYEETIESMNFSDVITYLGYIKRNDIDINIEKAVKITGKSEYELNKFDKLIEKMNRAIMYEKKMLIYFPTVALINRFYDYCTVKDLSKYVSRYHGQLKAYEKEENYQKFYNKDTFVMLATKAFGMGIDIDDIEVVTHFAPTGNVCDYVQEIGRAARRPSLKGEAYYSYMQNDFKHINRLHGLSTIKSYQLIEVIKKVYELYNLNLAQNKENKITKKRNEMLVDAENFSYIFENPFFSEDDGVNKVKTAMLLIQKDFERRFSFSPFHVRPIPMFEVGFFQIDSNSQENINKEYGHILNELDKRKHICSLNLKRIWEKNFCSKYSFPKFKYMLYTKDDQLNFKYKSLISPALSIDLQLEDNYMEKYNKYIEAIKTIINKSVRENIFYSENEIVDLLIENLNINKYKAKSIEETIISGMSVYMRSYSKSTQSRLFISKELKSGEIKYKFNNSSNGFFKWIDRIYRNIDEQVVNGKLYLIQDEKQKDFKEVILVLGILETLDLLVFKALGGQNSQIYIYVNQTKTMREIIEKPFRYSNKLLDIIGERHEISVLMLTYIFEGKFTNEEIWDLIEDYFLGKIPDKVMEQYENLKKKND